MPLLALEKLSIHDDEEEDIEHFVAVEGGAFVKCAEEDALDVYTRSLTGDVVVRLKKASRKSISKKRFQMNIVMTRSRARPRTRAKTIRLEL